MSVEAYTWALNLAPIPMDPGGGRKRPMPNSACAFVLVGLANHAGPDGKDSFPGVPTLMRYTRLSERTVRTALDRLEEEGTIRPCDPDVIAAKIKRGDRRPNGYDLVMERMRTDLTNDDLDDISRQCPWLRPWIEMHKRGAIAAPREHDGEPCDARGATAAPRERGATVAPREQARGATVAERGATHAARGATVAPKPSLEPSLEPSKDEDLFSLRSNDDANEVDGTPSADAEAAPSDVKPDFKVVNGDGSKRDTARGTRLPENWIPSAEVQAWTLAECPLVRKVDLEEFRDYWLSIPGAKARKADWDRTWKNRCREVQARKAERDQRWVAGGRVPANAHRPNGDITEQNRARRRITPTQPKQ